VRRVPYLKEEIMLKVQLWAKLSKHKQLQQLKHTSEISEIG